MIHGPGWLASLIRDVPDFPRPGVVFRDIMPLLAAPEAFAAVVEALAECCRGAGIDKVLGIEARGFILAAPVASRLAAGFVPVRKGGKLPGPVEGELYDLEYGQDRLELQVGALGPGDRVAIVDDVLATGGTAAATARLVERVGATVERLSFLVELAPLGGRLALAGRSVDALLTYEGSPA